ncbi:hypothetical protein ROHU_018401 [Labeo rohita]|uniref:Uncharacterized protein n=1 Tax=Labeo rohita TaxID=84645 RepID=A0A498NF06_LABRO|nr:hypothetical protein ROHU_018401 [Labeo rohita]
MKTRSTPLPLRFPSDCAHHCPLDAPVHALIPGYSVQLTDAPPSQGYEAAARGAAMAAEVRWIPRMFPLTLLGPLEPKCRKKGAPSSPRRSVS